MARYELIVKTIHLPNVDDVGDNDLLTIFEAAFLPELRGLFDDRQMLRATTAGRLQSSRPTGKVIYTTRAWVREWIGTPWHDPESPLASGTMKPQKRGASLTRDTKSDLVLARKNAKRLKGGWKAT